MKRERNPEPVTPSDIHDDLRQSIRGHLWWDMSSEARQASEHIGDSSTIWKLICEEYTDEFARRFIFMMLCHDRLEQLARFEAAQVLGSRQVDVENVASEAAFRVFVCGESPRQPEAWVRVVARRLALDVLRSYKRHPVVALDEQPTDVSDPTDDIELNETVRAALASIRSQRRREVVTLRYVYGLPERDVAAALRMPLNTVKSHAARGLADMRARLTETSESERGQGVNPPRTISGLVG